MHVELAHGVAFDIIDDVVADLGILIGAQLHMHGGEVAARAVIVHQQIVNAQYPVVLQNQAADALQQLAVRLLAQQRRYGFPGDADAGIEDEQRHHQAHPAVHVYVKEAVDQAANQHRRRGDHIVAAVRRCGVQGGGLDHFAQTPVEQRHPQLHQYGTEHDGDRRVGEIHRAGVDDLVHGGAGQLKADHQYHRGHHEAGQVFVAGVTVGMVLIGGALRHVKAQHGDDGGGRVRKIVYGVRHDGYRSGHQAEDQLGEEQQAVAHDAHHARQLADGGVSHGGVFPPVAPDEKTKKQFGHKMESSVSLVWIAQALRGVKKHPRFQ